MGNSSFSLVASFTDFTDSIATHNVSKLINYYFFFKFQIYLKFLRQIFWNDLKWREFHFVNMLRSNSFSPMNVIFMFTFASHSFKGISFHFLFLRTQRRVLHVWRRKCSRKILRCFLSEISSWCHGFWMNRMNVL